MSEPKTANQHNQGLTGSVQFVDHSKDFVTYKLKTKLGVEEPIRKLVEWLEAGANIIITTSDGKKKKVILQDVEE